MRDFTLKNYVSSVTTFKRYFCDGLQLTSLTAHKYIVVKILMSKETHTL